jgi:hypothetical protein
MIFWLKRVVSLASLHPFLERCGGHCNSFWPASQAGPIWTYLDHSSWHKFNKSQIPKNGNFILGLLSYPNYPSLSTQLLELTASFLCMRPGILRRSTSVLTDGSGDVSMEPLVEGAGKQKRVGIPASQPRWNNVETLDNPCQTYYIYTFVYLNIYTNICINNFAVDEKTHFWHHVLSGT